MDEESEKKVAVDKLNLGATKGLRARSRTRLWLQITAAFVVRN